MVGLAMAERRSFGSFTMGFQDRVESRLLDIFYEGHRRELLRGAPV